MRGANSTVIKSLQPLLRAECQAAGRYFASTIDGSKAATLIAFDWMETFQKLRMISPILVKLLNGAMPSRKRNRLQSSVCLILGILGKIQNKNAFLIQNIISLILLIGHASAQVSLHACRVYAGFHGIPTSAVTCIIAIISIYNCIQLAISISITIILNCRPMID